MNRILIGLFILLSSFIIAKDQRKPRFFIIGDSTVKNGQGRGDGGLWGWGDYLAPYFDTEKLDIENDALGGTSSRTFQTKGLWDKVLAKMEPGDFVIMQFGHNDSSPLDDTARARGTIKGVGDESKEIYNPITKQQEVVHTYGWYMSKFVNDAKAKGASSIICSPIPRNSWKDGKVGRAGNDYGKWSAETAASTGALFIDLNKLIAEQYDAGGQEASQQYFTEKDHTHTNKDGAVMNAGLVVEGIKSLPKSGLNKYLK
ncbi:MAG: rhamnogalacturonan acetylesterase [Chitinophagaceae bacterium]